MLLARYVNSGLACMEVPLSASIAALACASSRKARGRADHEHASTLGGFKQVAQIFELGLPPDEIAQACGGIGRWTQSA